MYTQHVCTYNIVYIYIENVAIVILSSKCKNAIQNVHTNNITYTSIPLYINIKSE